MTYNPNPIDTSDIVLSDELRELSEQLASNAHDVWARRRIAEGWIYGFKRDDISKHHPNLILYDDLPESEKEYDRDAVRETLKTIISLGYRITREKR